MVSNDVTGTCSSTRFSIQWLPEPQPCPRKRTKPHTACLACQHRKSKCEMLIPEGCRRCRTLRTHCSLALPTASTPTPEGYTSLDQRATYVSPGQGQRTGPEEKGILRQLDERTKRIEGLLRRETGVRQPPVIRKDEGCGWSVCSLLWGVLVQPCIWLRRYV